MIAAAERVCIMWAMGLTQHSNGSDTSTAISNLLLITGNYMRPGTGAYPLRGHNNVQGASDHGAMPNMMSGYQKVDDPEVRARFEAGWGVSLPSTKGLDNHVMVDAIHQGKLRSLYLVRRGDEPGRFERQLRERGVREARILRDPGYFFQPHLPVCRCSVARESQPRKEGTFTSTERRVQRLYQVLEPSGSRPDWTIIQDVANRLEAPAGSIRTFGSDG